jgi:extracellular matrix protein 14
MVRLWPSLLSVTAAALVVQVGNGHAKPSLEHLQNCNLLDSDSESTISESAQCAPIPVETQDAAFGGRSWIGRIVAGLQIPLFADSKDVDSGEEDIRFEANVNTVQFEDEIVLRFVVVSGKERAALLAAAETLLLDVWNEDGANIDVRIHRKRVKDLLKILPKPLRSSERRELLIADLQQAVVSSYPLVSYQESKSGVFGQSFFKDYRNLEAIYGFIDSMAEKYDRVSVQTIGKTFQGRDIKSVVVRGGPGGNRNEKSATVMVVSGVQARDWIAVSSTLYSLLQMAKEAPAEMDYIFIPVMNPDGYLYTWGYDRLWRKNRQPTGVSMCSGIDIDHSFYQDWQSGARTPCSEYYGGKAPLEALEAAAFSKFMNNTMKANDLVGFIQLQSYSSQILYADSQSLEFLRRWVPSGSDYSVLSLQDTQGHLEGSLLEAMADSHGVSAIQIKLPIDNQGILVPRTYINAVGEAVYKIVSQVQRTL